MTFLDLLIRDKDGFKRFKSNNFSVNDYKHPSQCTFIK